MTRKKSSAQAPKPQVTRVANHYTGNIHLLRSRGLGTVSAPAYVVPSGRSLEIPTPHWDEIQKNQMVQRYLAKGLLSVVSNDKPVAVNPAPSSTPKIPEHLQEAEVETGGGAKVGVRRAKSDATVNV